jgi:hypothetical protein
MAFNDLDKKRIEKAMDAFLAKRRPPVHIRSELDIGFRIEGQSVEIFEIRPQWDDHSVISQHPFVKATYVRTQNRWKVFWMRASLKWQSYEPVPTVASISEFLEVVDADAYCCDRPHRAFDPPTPDVGVRRCKRRNTWSVRPDFDTFWAHFRVTPRSDAGFRALSRQKPRYMDY